ncbi:unnamed protein product, partial [Amoebophrya sp. A120]
LLDASGKLNADDRLKTKTPSPKETQHQKNLSGYNDIRGRCSWGPRAFGDGTKDHDDSSNPYEAIQYDRDFLDNDSNTDDPGGTTSVSSPCRPHEI